MPLPGCFCYKPDMKSEFLLVLLVYFILLLAVGLLFRRKMKNLEDFFLASRNLPASLVYLSLAASWVGASSLLVSIDEAYSRGISSIWIMGVPAFLTVLVFTFFLVGPIRRQRSTTLPEMLEKRYGTLVRHLTAGLIVWYLILLTASQMVALGKFLGAFLGISYLTGLLLGTIVVMLYSTWGGFMSVVLTDGLQFLLLILGLSGLFFFLSDQTSLVSLASRAAELGRDGYFNIFTDINKNLLIVLSFFCAWIISPIAWQRIQSARSGKKARQGLLAAAATFLIIYIVIVLIGIFMLAQFPSGNQEGPLLSSVISTKTGFFLSALIFVAVTAAIMSTMDTSINTGALSLTRDIYQQVFFRKKQVNIVRVSRAATIAVTVLSFLIATRLQSILKTLGLASEILAEGLLIPGVAMLILRQKMPTAGLLSLLCGSGYAVAGFLSSIGFFPITWPEWPFSVPWGLGISGGGFLIGMAVDLRSRRPRLNK